jgi:GNAT superfamily N-acetyltransferase
MDGVFITSAKQDEFALIWPIFQAVTATGDTYIYPHDIDYFLAEEIWMKGTDAFLLWKDDKVIGSYVIRANKIGRGSHVCNAGFMIHPDYQGQGIGKILGIHALEQAKHLGYLAMQFNIIVSTNVKSVALWKSLQFQIVGTIPKGFLHAENGLVDIYIMHRFL